LLVTPDFHHWHYASDNEAIDRNYDAHYAFLDYVFDTVVTSRRSFRNATAWPATTCRTVSSGSSCFRSAATRNPPRRRRTSRSRQPGL